MARKLLILASREPIPDRLLEGIQRPLAHPWGAACPIRRASCWLPLNVGSCTMGQIESNESTIATATLRSVLKSQYHAALAMLRETLERCPEDVWIDKAPVKRFGSSPTTRCSSAMLTSRPTSPRFGLGSITRPMCSTRMGSQGRRYRAAISPLIPEPYTRGAGPGVLECLRRDDRRRGRCARPPCRRLWIQLV